MSGWIAERGETEVFLMWIAWVTGGPGWLANEMQVWAANTR